MYSIFSSSNSHIGDTNTHIKIRACKLIAIMADNVYESTWVWHWCGFWFPSIYFMAHSRFFAVLILILGLFVNLSLIELIAFYQPEWNLCRSTKKIHTHSLKTRSFVLPFFFHFTFYSFFFSFLILSLGSDCSHLMHFTILG